MSVSIPGIGVPFLVDVTGYLVEDNSVRSWCLYPYSGHPKGCPNWNKSKDCPPKVDYVDVVYDLTHKHWFSIVTFDIGSHAKRMKEKHPDWSDRQCRCVLYWQNSVRKVLRKYTESIVERLDNHGYTLIPEGMGVNVFRTAHRIGIMVRKKPKDILYKIALIARLK